MDICIHPGKGLSLSQLIFALNEELKRVAYSPLFTLEVVSRLNQDASLALATIRQWKNTFAPINRLPLDIISIIPTYLTSQRDRFHAASVCRRWRGALLEHGSLWSQLFLKKGEEYVSTLLKRAKGSALDVITSCDVPTDVVALISPRAQQIRCLEFRMNFWKDILLFSEFNSGELPLLRILKIIPVEAYDSNGRIEVSPSSNVFFGGSINLEHFVLSPTRLQPLGLFAFPNLTTFELSVYDGERCSALILLNFLEASPSLRTVKICIPATITPEGIPLDLVVTLRNVETFSLHTADNSTRTHLYDIAAHISCPRSRETSLTQAMDDDNMGNGMQVFPTPDLWNKIIHQYTTSLLEEVTLEATRVPYEPVKCSLTFRSPDTTTLTLGFEVVDTGTREEDLQVTYEEMGWEVFAQALVTIEIYPRLDHIRHLSLMYRVAAPRTSGVMRGEEEVEGLFSSLGPLDNLTINGCDLHSFLSAFLDNPHLCWGLSVEFPPIRELTILHPLMDYDEVECMEAIVRLAKSQHEAGVPFERVTIRMWRLPTGMVEELGQWVGEVCYCKEFYRE